MSDKKQTASRLLLNNAEWSSQIAQLDPDYFKELAKIQTPGFLWIGCSDSRVPADRITGTQPGEIFVHRNIANMVVNTDFNLLSVLEYAVHYLNIREIIVCGHYGCGGVQAALSTGHYEIINKWIRTIKDIYIEHRPEIDQLPTEEEKVNRMVELNVQEQVANLAKTSIVQRAWAHGEELVIHGWVYSLKNGVINPICKMNNTDELDPIYVLDKPTLPSY